MLIWKTEETLNYINRSYELFCKVKFNKRNTRNISEIFLSLEKNSKAIKSYRTVI